MKRNLSILAIALLGLLFAACSTTSPVAPVVPAAGQGYIVDLEPSLAWVDLSANTCELTISNRFIGSVAGDTITLEVTAFTADAPTNTAIWPYRSGEWSWVMTDAGNFYKTADSLQLRATWWNQGWPKQTVDLWADVRLGDK